MNRVHLEVDSYAKESSQGLVTEIHEKLEIVSAKKAEAIFVIGGDGAMHEAIRRHHQFGVPFYGLNFGHVGFLMSKPTSSVLKQIISGRVNQIQGRLLKADLFDCRGNMIKRVLAFQDFYLERSNVATANIKVTVNGKVRFNPLICDGVIISTPAGATAYTASAGGIIPPLDSRLLVLTGASPALFHGWRTTPLSEDSVVEIEALNTNHRPVRFLVSGKKVPGVTKAVIRYSDQYVSLGFARSENFREKVLRLQFNGK